MATSKEDICNSALIHLGAKLITSITENNDRARAMNQFYPLARDAALIQAEWNFAITQKTLTKLVDTPLFGHAFMYELPTNPYCLKPLIISKPEQDVDWKVKGRNVYTDRDGVDLEYIFRNEDVSQYSSLFELYMSYLLASMSAYTITSNRALVGDMKTLADDALADAAGVDSQVGIPEGFTNESLTSVRI